MDSGLGVADHDLKVPQRRDTSCFTAGVATDHAAALLPGALALDLVGGRAVLGYAADSAASRATLIVSPIAFISASDTWFT